MSRRWTIFKENKRHIKWMVLYSIIGFNIIAFLLEIFLQRFYPPEHREKSWIVWKRGWLSYVFLIVIGLPFMAFFPEVFQDNASELIGVDNKVTIIAIVIVVLYIASMVSLWVWTWKKRIAVDYYDDEDYDDGVYELDGNSQKTTTNNESKGISTENTSPSEW